MNINGRTLTWLAPLLLLLAFPLWRTPLGSFLAPRGGYDPSLTDKPRTAHDFTMNTVHITQSHYGLNTLDVTATKAMTGETPDEFIMADVNALITDEKKEQTHVTARKGVFSKKTSKLSLMNQVVIKKPADKYEIYTELLHYDDKTKKADCPGATKLVGEKVTIRGGSLKYDMSTQSYDIGGRVFCKLTNFDRP